MGNTWTISIWQPAIDGDGYEYVCFWRGESKIKAFFMLWRARRYAASKDFHCVRFEWRG